VSTTKTSTKILRKLPKVIQTPIDATRAVVSGALPRDPAYAKLNKAALNYRYITAILFAHELGMLDVLHQGPQDAEMLGERCDIHPRAAQNMLRILESMDLLKRTGDTFSLTSFARDFLSSQGRDSQSPLLDLMAAQANSFSEILEGMRTGQIPDGLNIFSDEARYPAFLSAVNEYMHWAGADLLSQIRLPEIKSFITGSMGVSFSALLLKQQKRAKVTFGCLDHLTREIPRLCEEYGITQDRVVGMHSHSGDPRLDSWGDESFDLIFLTKKMILEPDEGIGEAFAEKAFEVLNPGGVTIFWESIHPEDSPTPLGRAMEAVLDFGASPTGPCRTDKNFERYLKGVGYSQIEVIPCLNDHTTFIVARKR